MAAATRPVRTCAAVLVMGSLAACAGNSPPRSAPEPREVASPPAAASPAQPRRSDRGNPPFYDVLGKRYHVLPTSAGYVARGVASWYGRDFHGLATSSGETYDMNAMTAAHTTLPLPTWVEVTNLANGKRVVVKVNDRGPFVDNRLIDLSYAAATALDMVADGHDARRGSHRRAAARRDSAPVPPSPPPRPRPRKRRRASVPVERMFVQIGAFADAENAERLVARLRASGFANPTVVSQPNDGRRLHRVWLGPVRDSVEFDEIDTRLRSIGMAGSRLVVDRAP